MGSTRTVVILALAAALVLVTVGAAAAGWLLYRDGDAADGGSDPAAPGESWSVVRVAGP